MAAAVLFLCAGVGVGSLFVRIGPGEIASGSWPGVIAIASPLVFLCACALVPFRATLGYILGGIAGLAALPWLVLSESSVLPSIWTVLNGPDEYGGNGKPFGILKILSVALVAAALTCALLRLLFSRLSPLGSAVSRRTWPALVVAVLVLVVWWAHSASPWMIPGSLDASSPDLGILHVEKHGLQYHETSIEYSRNGRFSVGHNDRRLLQYGFRDQSTNGEIPPIIHERVNELARSIARRSLRTAPPKALRSWNAEGWYLRLPGSPLLAFTSEYGTTPPREAIDLFEQIEGLPGTQRFITIQDVCLGFCYDPVAGLGFWYWNQRCYAPGDGTTRCL